jgi:poly-beta-hydroxybutyrate-responsive repressor
LLLLSEKPSYGYELIEGVSEFGFQDSSPDPGAIYRNLRRLEEDGFVISEWETGDSGPAKRYYKLTSDGQDLLRAWASGIRKRKEAFEKFLHKYQEQLKKRGVENV